MSAALQRPIVTSNSPSADIDMEHGVYKHHDATGLDNGNATMALAAAIRESTDKVIRAMGAPRTTIGVASALGLFAFAVPNFGNAMWQLQLLPIPQLMANQGMLAAVLMVAFLGQFLAGLWNLTKGDTFGAVAMGSYGLFWGMYWYFIQYSFTGMVEEGMAPVAAGGGGMGQLQAINQANAMFGYLAIPWLVLTTTFVLCALRMALLELWIFIVVDCVFVCVIGSQFASYGSSTQVAWTKALGAWSLILAITAWYFVAVILVNTTYNAHVLPMGHSRPIIMNWPHEFGSVMHQDTHRKLNLYIPDKKMHRTITGDDVYNAENQMHRTTNIKGHPAPEEMAMKQV